MDKQLEALKAHHAEMYDKIYTELRKTCKAKAAAVHPRASPILKLAPATAITQLPTKSSCQEELGLIHLAAVLGYEWATTLIVDAGVDISFQEARGQTALDFIALLND
ncbi:hypothetical protein ACFE04_029283 [Oxalis oulophora]